METLILIPARGGSKGIPNKNIKLLRGKPLIQYTIEIARALVEDSDICVSTDSEDIKSVAEGLGLKVPFIRPLALASDTAGSRGVILHALDFFASQNKTYDNVILMQPTSPFRRLTEIQKMISMYEEDLDMVVSVRESHANPYFSLFEENSSGFLELSKRGDFIRRQDCPAVFAYNGSVYIINVTSVRKNELNEFKRIKKFVMDDVQSVDIDTPFDWLVSEMILEKSLWTKY